MENVKKILDEVLFGTLGTTDENSQPKLAPLHFASDGENIYWFSAEKANHSRNIERGGEATFAVFTDDRLPNLKCVVVENFAKIGDEIARDTAIELFAKKYGAFPEPFANYEIYVLPLGEIDEARTFGEKYYLTRGL